MLLIHLPEKYCHSILMTFLQNYSWCWVYKKLYFEKIIYVIFLKHFNELFTIYILNLYSLNDLLKKNFNNMQYIFGLGV